MNPGRDSIWKAKQSAHDFERYVPAGPQNYPKSKKNDLPESTRVLFTKNGNFKYFPCGGDEFPSPRQKTIGVDVEECARKNVEGLAAPARNNFA